MGKRKRETKEKEEDTQQQRLHLTQTINRTQKTRDDLHKLITKCFMCQQGKNTKEMEKGMRRTEEEVWLTQTRNKNKRNGSIIARTRHNNMFNCFDGTRTCRTRVCRRTMTLVQRLIETRAIETKTRDDGGIRRR